MSSEQLADGVNPLDAELAATWDVLKGYSGRDTDLEIARRFGGAAAAYSLRNVGSDGLPVVKVRRDVDGQGSDPEEDFSAHQVQDGILEDWVNGKLESTLPADVATAAAAYSLRKVKADYGAPTTKLDGSDGFPSNLNDLPLGNYFNAISGSTFTVGHFSTNSSAADSVSLSLGNNSFTLRADKATSGAQYGHVIRVQGLSVGKRYTVTGEFRVIKGNGSGTVRMTVDISDATSETDETSIATTNNYLTPFEITALFNDAGANKNFIDFTLNDFGGPNSGSGPIEGEFRNIKIVESDNRVVRLRRSSDNVEVDVDFDTEGKLSTNSLVGDIAEQGGESGSTTATTLGDFISGTDAFVHTWYDQAGSNDAVQSTAANQPKIAENGALLADGLLFDGSNDSFEAADITNVNFPATVVSVSETNKTGSPNTALYSLNNDSNACCGFYRSTSKYAINNGTTTVEGSATYTTGVHRLKFDLFNGASSAGFSNAVSDISGDIGTQVSQVTHFRIAGSLKAGITNPHNGTIKEIILYTSDQSANRFKIESNINNYYGLYNDANDFASDETSFRFLNERSGGTSASSNLSQFTLDVQTASAYAGAKLSSDVLSGDAIYVSFNCSFDSGSPSPKIALRDIDSALNGGVRSNEENITEGFNSFTLTSTNDAASGIVWSEGDDNVIFSVTDIKVSRIARNGFVETWYDQSGNGNDATQGSAGNQPAIVQNGGRNLDGVEFDGSNDFLNIANSLPITGANPRSVFAVVNKDVSSSGDNILGIGDDTNNVNSQLWNLATTYGLYYNGGNTVFGAGSLSTEQLVTAIYPSTATDSGDTVFFIDGSSSSITSSSDTTLATDNTVSRVGKGGGSLSGVYDGSIQELIVFDSDKLSDRTDIEQDIKNFYDI